MRMKEILDLLVSGAWHDEILANYPYLEPGDIAAALENAPLQEDRPISRVWLMLFPEHSYPCGLL
jgi:uncharacterized protein (DUF433 family)